MLSLNSTRRFIIASMAYRKHLIISSCPRSNKNAFDHASIIATSTVYANNGGNLADMNISLSDRTPPQITMGFLFVESFETKDSFTSDMLAQRRANNQKWEKAKKQSLKDETAQKQIQTPPLPFPAPTNQKTNPYQQELYHQTLQQEIYRYIVRPQA